MYAFYIESDHAGSQSDYWSKSWGAVGIQERNAGRTILLSTEYHEIRRRLSSPAKLLEAGCGHGLWVLRLAQKGYDIVGLDFSQPTIEALRDKFPEKKWIVGDVRRTDFASNTFDGILSWGVIEHFQDGCDDILQETYRILKPGGYLFLTVPYLNSMLVRLWGTDSGSNYQNVNSEKAKFFQYYMTKEELALLIERAGFTTEKFATVQKHVFQRWTTIWILRKVQILANSLLGKFVNGENVKCMLLCVARKPG